MVRKTLLTAVLFAVALALTIVAGFSLSQESSVVPLSQDTPCPAVGCASGECHDYANVPVPDGVHEMTCPEASCSSVDCHAWDALSGGYRQASDASLNVWILAPVALVVALVAMVLLLSRGMSGAREPEGASREGSSDISDEGSSDRDREGGR